MSRYLTPRKVAIGLAVAAVSVGLSVALGNYLTVEPVRPVQLSSAADGCNRVWALMNSDKSNKQKKAELLALAAAFEQFDPQEAESSRLFGRNMPTFRVGKLADGFYRRCVNEHDWPPPTQEIADMREPPERSAN